MKGSPLPPQFMSAAEVAALLRVTRSTVYRMLKRGQIKSIIVGDAETGVHRIPIEEVRRFITI